MSDTAITEDSLNSLLQRVVSPSWQNKSFLLSSPQRTLMETITHIGEGLCGGPGAQQRSRSAHGDWMH